MNTKGNTTNQTLAILLAVIAVFLIIALAYAYSNNNSTLMPNNTPQTVDNDSEPTTLTPTEIDENPTIFNPDINVTPSTTPIQDQDIDITPTDTITSVPTNM